MSNGDIYMNLAMALAGHDKPLNAQVVVSLSKARDVHGLASYLKHLVKETA